MHYTLQYHLVKHIVPQHGASLKQKRKKQTDQHKANEELEDSEEILVEEFEQSGMVVVILMCGDDELGEVGEKNASLLVDGVCSGILAGVFGRVCLLEV